MTKPVIVEIRKYIDNDWHEDDLNGESLADRYYEELCYE
jgi:hypothetical protein